MTKTSRAEKLAMISLLSLILTSCQNPTFRNFNSSRGSIIPLDHQQGRKLERSNKDKIIRQLNRAQIMAVEYGDTLTLVIPTDRYYVVDSARFNGLCPAGLANIINLLKLYPSCCPIYVASFTDNVGSWDRKRKMSQDRAETMVSYLWANNIPAQRLNAEGYSDKNTVSDNKLIHGSAQNRRIEIQLLNNCMAQPSPYVGVTK